LLLCRRYQARRRAGRVGRADKSLPAQPRTSGFATCATRFRRRVHARDFLHRTLATMSRSPVGGVREQPVRALGTSPPSWACSQRSGPESLSEVVADPGYDTHGGGVGRPPIPDVSPKDALTFAPGTGRRPCSTGDLDDAKGLTRPGGCWPGEAVETRSGQQAKRWSARTKPALY